MLFFLEVYKKSPAGSPVGDFCLNGAEAVLALWPMDRFGTV